MSKKARVLQPIAVIGIGLVLALASAAVSHPPRAFEAAGAAALVVQATETPAPQAASEVGSTDGIMLMSIVIVVIVIVPILVRRRSWMR
jgi:hypothetical protein